MFSGYFKPEGKTVLITGGSQGLGAELAIQLFSRGANVIILARTESKLKATIRKIEAKRVNESQTSGYRAVDLSVYEETERALDGIDPDIVFFCAGSSVPKLFTDLSPDELKQGVDINLNTSLNVSHIIMRKMISEKRDYSRHFVFCSSILAVFPFIGYGQYAPSKTAIRSLSDILRHEGEPFNIKVHTIIAGNFQSEGFEKEEETKPEITKTIEGPSNPISVQECAAKVLYYLDQGQEVIFTDFVGWALYSGMMGFSPRYLGFFQAICGLVLSIIIPIAMIFIRRDIANYFKKNK